MKTSRLFQLATGDRLKWGLFAGMRYIDQSIGSSYGPKLLGTYEKELLPIFSDIISQSYDKMIDVGAAEGYYAIGYCTKTSGIPVVAFEGEKSGRDLIANLARINNVTERVTIREWCDPESLHHELQGLNNPLIIMDCEGSEQILLNPQTIPELLRARILVELHDFIVPGIRDLIFSRFSSSHFITPIQSCSRTLQDAPLPFRLASLLTGPARLLSSLNEGRPQTMLWLDMQPKSAFGL